MYTTHYGLSAKPFSIVPDPNILFLSKNHENALTYLEYGISEKAGFVLLTGEIGIGKTTLIRHMLNNMPAMMDTAVIFNTNFSSDQLFRRILSEFELPCDTADKGFHLETLYHFLIEQYARGRQTLLVIDEAQNLSDEVLEDIRMLFNLQTDNHILLQIILVGQPDLKRRISSPGLRQLAQRIVVNYHLSPLSEEQTSQYIKHRLQSAGAAANLFSAEAMQLIYQNSGGIPRTINLLCEAGLVYGYAGNKPLVDREIVENVLKDRICIAAAAQEQSPPAMSAPMPDKPTVEMLERITAIETALADVQYRQEKVLNEIRSEFDQRLQELEAIPPPLNQSHPYQEEEAAAVGTSDPPASFTFKDSAVAHTIEFENGQYAREADAPAPDHHFSPAYGFSKADLQKISKTVRTRILPYLDITYAWGRRLLSNRFALWSIILLIPLAAVWAMLGEDEPPPARYADRVVDSAPPPDLVGMNYDDASPFPETAADSRETTPTDPKKKEKAITHTIQSGETLLSIAKHYGVSASALKKENHLRNSHLIYVGQKLRVPLDAQ